MIRGGNGMEQRPTVPAETTAPWGHSVSCVVHFSLRLMFGTTHSKPPPWLAFGHKVDVFSS